MKSLGILLVIVAGLAPAQEPEQTVQSSIADSASSGWVTSYGGHVAAEARWFTTPALDSRQSDFAPSFVLAPQLKLANKEYGVAFNATPFGRFDFQDERRTHADLREFNLTARFDDSDILVGVGKVFWGATEFVHWVDVINQTDLIEDLDGKSKLGQPMVNYNYFSDFGQFSFFVLPGFRERTFAGPNGRLRMHPRIMANRAIYESAAGQEHVDFAMRWSKTFGDLDVGLSWFRGTTREPTYRLGKEGAEIVLLPYYELISQIGLDATWTIGDLLIKSEVMQRSGQGNESFYRAAGGFEYTFHAVAGTQTDVGVIGEFLYDSSGNNEINPFENDIAFGFRFGFNDIHDTTLLTTAITDPDDGATFFNLESTMRLSGHWLIAAKGRAFAGVPSNDFPLNGLRRDHYVQIGLEYHF